MPVAWLHPSEPRQQTARVAMLTIISTEQLACRAHPVLLGNTQLVHAHPHPTRCVLIGGVILLELAPAATHVSVNRQERLIRIVLCVITVTNASGQVVSRFHVLVLR